MKPDKEILEKIKNLNFDFYQIYNCTPDEIKYIKQKYQKKIITAITVKNSVLDKKSCYFIINST